MSRSDDSLIARLIDKLSGVEAATRDELSAYAADTNIGPCVRVALGQGPESHAWLNASRAVNRLDAARMLALETGTVATMPRHQWRARVVEVAKVADADVRRLCASELHGWANSGIEVRVAAARLSELVRERLCTERADNDFTGALAYFRRVRGTRET